jgi:homoserine kinase
MRFTVRAPATAANLGPGFDTLALALDLWNEVEVDLDASPAVEVSGQGAGELPEDASNLVIRSMTHIAREAGRVLPPLALRCINRIPLERGLGSSAAAVVGGLVAADRLLGLGLEPDRLLEVAVDVEGHADNVAACLRGGLVIAYLSSEGWRAERLDPHDDLRPVLVIPEHDRLATADARRVLPRDVPLAEAAFNVGRTALVVVALTRNLDVLPVALEDRLHQRRRLPLTPESRAVFEDLRTAGVPVCVAGAGPSLLAFETGDVQVPELGPSWRTLRLQVARNGADVHPEGH